NFVSELFLKHNAPSPINCTKFFLSLYETTLPPEERGGETKHSFGGVGFFLIFDLCKRSNICYKKVKA
ncbi:MAG: hypothetical protein V7K71_27280, partial [Nostoc sp.]|uniref:hypothetical protein n=1 Tax=Nostoc sp. TaxID=1180 RepID=UPI002FF5E703